MQTAHPAFADQTVDVYLLPRTPWLEVLRLQKRLIFELGGIERERAAVILCEHAPILTIGRQGSMRHLPADPESACHRLPIRWTNRGGGCWPQLPGTLAAYPVVPLNPKQPNLGCFRDRLQRAIAATLASLQLAIQPLPDRGLCTAEGRTVAAVGLAVQDWVAYHGAWINLTLPSELTQHLQVTPIANPISSVFREVRTPIQWDGILDAFLYHFHNEFGFAEGRRVAAEPMPTAARTPGA